jgi:hypothetical protein
VRLGLILGISVTCLLFGSGSTASAKVANISANLKASLLLPRTPIHNITKDDISKKAGALSYALLGSAAKIATMRDTPAIRFKEFGLVPLSTAEFGWAFWRAKFFGTLSLTEAESQLSEAQRLEAHFDSRAANTIRQRVLKDFTRLVRSDDGWPHIVRKAVFGQLSSLYHTKRLQEAAGVIDVGLKLMGTEALSRQAFAPPVARWLKKQLSSRIKPKEFPFEVRSPGEGEVWSEARLLGKLINGQWVGQLPAGEHRIWVRTQKGWSFAHRLALGGEGLAKITLDANLEACLMLKPTPHLRCMYSPKNLEVVANYLIGLGANTTLGVAIVGQDNEPQATPWLELFGPSFRASANVEQHTLLAQESPVLKFNLARFDTRYLIPFGGAQFVQNRPLAASLYLLSSLATLAWLVGSFELYHSQVEHRGLKTQQELDGFKRSWSLLQWSTALPLLLFPPVEALVYGAVVGVSDLE